MFAQQERFEDGAVFARFAAGMGYAGIEISHSTEEGKLRAIAAAGVLPIVSLHQPAPLARYHDGRANSELNLAALDAEERRAAVAYALKTIDLAADVGARKVVVHLGHVDGEGLGPAMHEVYRAYHEGWAERRAAAVRQQSIKMRADLAPAHVEAARRSLLELVERGADSGVALGLENRLNYHEIPHPGELPTLLEGVEPEQAGYWHDVGHAEVLARLGYIDRLEWFRADVATIGAHVHDVDGIIDHRAPGDGDVEWGYLAQNLGHLDSYTLEINQHQPDERVAAAIPYLRSVGLG
jgi:sugar phosphate isomerase/epimerase